MGDADTSGEWIELVWWRRSHFITITPGVSRAAVTGSICLFSRT